MFDGYENAPQSTEVGRRIQRFGKDMLGNDIPPNNPPPQKIASMTKECQFSAAMMDQDVQLVFVNEWSHSTLE